MRCSIGPQWDGVTCLGGPEALSQQEANDYADELNKSGGYAGLNNRRVPNLNELSTVRELHCGPLRINGQVFPGAEAKAYWSRTAAHYVRLVRGHE